MKKTCTLLALSFIAAASSFAQDGQPQRPPPRDGGPAMHRPPGPLPPLMSALDANKDRKIDAQEIANASAALRKLDKNGDGELTEEELFQPRLDGVRPEGAPGNRRPDQGNQSRPGPRPSK